MKIKEKDADLKLIELATPQFLETLTEVARLYGWSGDYYEIAGFVEGLYSLAGLDMPYLEPHEIEYEDE